MAERARAGSMNRKFALALRDNQAARFTVRLRAVATERDSIRRKPRETLRFLFRSREVSNFTYDLRNLDQMISFVGELLERPTEEVRQYVDELRNDSELLTWLRAALANHPRRDPEPRFGCRLAWYAIVRIVRPRTIVETGVYDGLGSIALLRALERNATEGAEGTLLSFDIGDRAGWLIPDFLRPRFRLIAGDAKETLPRVLAGQAVDLMIHDSLHRFEHETFEFETALEHAAPTILLVSDDANMTNALHDLCKRLKVPYRAFREDPDHFYVGKELGVAIVSRAQRT